MHPKYPIYIISKGRWESRLTAKSLDKMDISYLIVVEPKEYDNYAAVIDKQKILVLPKNFSEYKRGGIPARNYVWNHAKKSGAKRHWIMDDNINGFGRLNKNTKIQCESPACLVAIEDFIDRYSNIKMAGLEYDYFLPRKVKHNPYRLNTRVYSCMILSNDIDIRWRGRYNEDTDLSLRLLKQGFCTVLFQAFYCYKTPTMIMKGGNTDTIYNKGDNRREFAESLKRQHPDVTKVVWRYDRWHHEVNYAPFLKNKLIRIKDVADVVNNYNMVLKDLRTNEIL